MSTINIPAREVKAGDVIDFGGQPFTVAWSNSAYREDLWVLRIGTKYNPEPVHWLPVGADDMFTVTRPDPDAELIEVMAKAIGDRLESNWRSEKFDERSPRAQRLMRDDARAALAAAREAGLL